MALNIWNTRKMAYSTEMWKPKYRAHTWTFEHQRDALFSYIRKTRAWGMISSKLILGNLYDFILKFCIKLIAIKNNDFLSGQRMVNVMPCIYDHWVIPGLQILLLAFMSSPKLLEICVIEQDSKDNTRTTKCEQQQRPACMKLELTNSWYQRKRDTSPPQFDRTNAPTMNNNKEWVK